VLIGEAEGRASARDITTFDSTGLAATNLPACSSRGPRHWDGFFGSRGERALIGAISFRHRL